MEPADSYLTINETSVQGIFYKFYKIVLFI